MKSAPLSLAGLLVITFIAFGLALASLLFPAARPAQADVQVPADARVATFAGGCFWCVESGFEAVPGVLAAVSGYTGGSHTAPTYNLVASGRTRHIESVKVTYDPAVISYEGLLAAFWRMVDPTDAGGQFVDRGYQYSTAIFYHDEKQKAAAEASVQALDHSGRFEREIVTPIRPATDFYVAEDYHQDYYKKNPVRYKLYRFNSGRDQYLEKVWGDDLALDFAVFAPAQKRTMEERAD